VEVLREKGNYIAKGQQRDSCAGKRGSMAAVEIISVFLSYISQTHLPF